MPNFTFVFFSGSENITSDILQGCAVVTLTLLAFIGLVWLREQVNYTHISHIFINFFK